MNEENLKKLEQMIKLLDGGVSKKDFEASFSKVLEMLVKMEQRNSEAIANMQKTHQMMMEKMGMEHSNAYSDLKNRVDHVFVEDAMKKMEKEHSEKMATMHKKMDEKMAMVRDGKDGKSVDEMTVIDKIMMKIPDMTAEYKNIKRELAQLKDETKKAIDGAVDGLQGRINSIPKSGFRASHSTKFHALTADGSTTVFIVPKSETAILHCSDFPNILYEGSGFTLNANRTQLTITTDNAPSDGAQLIYQYSSVFN